jgi:hypothetical protein
MDAAAQKRAHKYCKKLKVWSHAQNVLSVSCPWGGQGEEQLIGESTNLPNVTPKGVLLAARCNAAATREGA